MLFFSAIYYGLVYVFFVPQLILLFFSKAILLKKLFLSEKCGFRSPVFIGKVYFYLVIP